MTSNVFTAFLNRHNSELIAQFGTYFTSELPPVVQAQASSIANNAVQFYVGRILGTLSLDSEVMQEVIKGILSNRVSNESLRGHVDKFFEILDQLRVADTTLSKTEQAHIQRMLTQSHKFLLVDLFSIRQENLKKD